MIASCLSFQAACAPSQAQVPSSGATAAPAAAPAAAPSSSAPGSNSGLFEASIVTVAISMEDVALRRVRIEFHNNTDRACTVAGYLVQWPGGKKPARPEGIVIPPKESRDRWLRVDKADGDVSSLTADVAKVTLQSDCPVKGP